jgi:class 3 adenylate cyclase
MPWMVPPGTFGSQNLKSARAGRASRAGARAGRIVRIVRMIKLYKYATVQKDKKAKAEQAKSEKMKLPSDSSVSPYPHRGSVFVPIQEEDEEQGDGLQEEIEEVDAAELPPESHVGAAMSDITTRRVIVLVLSMLIIIPLLNYTPTPLAREFGVHTVHQMSINNYTHGGYDAELALAVDSVRNRLHALKVKSNGVVLYEAEHLGDHRQLSEIVVVHKYGYGVPGVKEFKTEITFDYKSVSVTSAQFGIYQTLFVLFLLVVGTFMFSSDVNRLVINPIERMVQLVQKISKDPLGQDYAAVSFDEDEGFLAGMETTLLLQTITKIGSLMRVGFGEAGANVIANVLGNSSGGEINLIGAENGRLIHSIFGFCDVRNFTDTTECLQEEVMLFVNRIAHILHSIVVQCAGSANKNIGDAFLLTWKIEETFKPKKVSELADNALRAFCHSIIELCRYQDFIMDFSVQATNKLYKRNLTKCRIGSGLHVGWAIEGAIGSPLKIDASYLSPHVNMSEYLESSTKAYGVPLLLSEAFYRLLTPTATKWIRQVDRVRRSEMEEPFGLFTYDADLDLEWAMPALLELAPLSKSVGNRSSTRNEHTSRREKGGRRSSSKPTDDDLSALTPVNVAPTLVITPYEETVWDTDDDLVMLRHHIKDSFRVVWKEGIAGYIKGDWQKARDIFHETLQMSEGLDGPSKFLIGIIDSYGGSAPQDWHGYRTG